MHLFKLRVAHLTTLNSGYKTVILIDDSISVGVPFLVMELGGSDFF
jgi:hypothetical protein